MPSRSTIVGRFSALVLGVWCGVLPRPALAQAPVPAPPPVRIAEAVVVTASAWPADANRIGRSVTVLTGEDLRRLGIGVVADALRLVPGVDVRARGPRDGWSLDGGADWSARGWTVSLSPFVRWDANVIDWLRPTPTDRWRSTNVRDVRTTGLEIGVTRRWRAALLRGGVTALDVEAPALTQLSKYVLEYARQSITGSITAPVAGRLRLAITADHRRRYGGRSDTLVGARVSLAFARGDVYVDGTNILNENYYEVAGVAMPGRWISVGFMLR